MKGQRDFSFAELADSYDTNLVSKLTKRFYKLLVRQVRLADGMSVLDVGCGTGTSLKQFSEISNINGYGIDIEENMILVAKAKCPDMDFAVSDCTETSFADGQFDVIVSCLAYHHFADKEGFAKEAARILKPQGALYIVDPRLPWAIRKPMNTALKIHRIKGAFSTPLETVEAFQEYGFSFVGQSQDFYAQCVSMQKAG
ncbi:MAG: class I SAM-dependent methyltransferase [Coriobacteriia bacterium]|nr:class I SAM-dependent methyltransferase [Coriobacteriia bacterium]